MKKFIMLLFVILAMAAPGEASAKKVPILVYHSIADYTGTGQKELYVPPENFRKQIEYLKANGFTLLTFEQWGKVNEVDKPVFITLDDSYKNNTAAEAIFASLTDGTFKPVATLFVISDFIGNPNRLSALDLKRMAGSGMFSVQSHTATHPDLTKTASLSKELLDSKIRIAKITGKPVIAISYPYGNADAKVVAETKKHYKFGLTTTPGAFVKKDLPDELYLLPRIYVKHSTTMADFAKIVNPGGDISQ